MTKKAKNKYLGSSLDDFLAEEGVLDEFTANAVKRVIAWQLAQEMKKQKLTKHKMADLMRTSRTQIERVLDPESGNVTLNTLNKAAKVLGRRISVELC